VKSQRHEKILEELRNKTPVYVSRLSKLLAVSEPTVRKDLETLEQSGLLKRIHGGAIAIEASPDGNETDFLARSQEHPQEKVSIARLAFTMIKDHDSILLDASSTCYELSKIIADSNLNLTITTSGLKTATLLSANNRLRIYIVGGSLRNNNAITGLLGAGLLNKIHIHKAFVSARGIDVPHGLTDFSFEEGELKSYMLQHVTEIYALVDHTKLGQVSVASFCPLSRVTEILTDPGATPQQISMFTSEGITVSQAPTTKSSETLS
jgi:DeoR/GlpR family transcriptional regulator of sugar metabolism